MKLSRIVLAAVCLVLGAQGTAWGGDDPKVYALFAFDTDIEGFRAGAKDADATRVLRTAARKNRDMILAAFVQSFNRDGRRHRLEYKILEGQRVTWENILGYWDTIQPAPHDTLVFYYFGHGAVDSHLGHYLALTHGAPVYRSYIRSAMQGKSVRLCVLMTDCCSSFIDATGGLVRVAEGANWEVMSQLLFGPTGMVDVTAAEPGTEAFATTGGGYFTESLVHHFCGPLADAEVEIDGRLSWAEFLGSVRHRVKHHHKRSQSQHVFFLNHAWPRVFRERQLIIHNRSQHTVDVYVQHYSYHSGNRTWGWYGSTFYTTGLPTPTSKFWTVGRGQRGHLRDGEYIIRGDHCYIYAKSRDANWHWPRKKFMLVYGKYGYIPDTQEMESIPYYID
jgi:hypothetical protein